MSFLLETKEITKKYAHHTALDKVSVHVPRGNIFGLLGPNGAGKTSLIRIINQITGPDQGEVIFGGEPLRPDHIQQIGYLPEERGLYRKMKVGEQAMYLAQLKGMSRKDAVEQLKIWFRKFEIAAWWDRKVEELSKGMQQKVQFIVTVLHRPRLLILDEPFSGFDPINTNLIKQEILALRNEGATIIFSTHNMGSVEEICDHIALINKSRKILEGSVKDVKAAYKSNSYELTGKGNVIAFTGSMWTTGELLSHTQADGLAKIRVKIPADGKLNALLQAVMPQFEIHSVNEIIPSMNDIFIKKVTEMEGSPGTETDKQNALTGDA